MYSHPLDHPTQAPLEPAVNIPEPPKQDSTQQESEDEDSNFVVIPIDRSFSDGDPAQWPTEERFGRPDDTSYRQKLADLWLRKIGAHEAGEPVL